MFLFVIRFNYCEFRLINSIVTTRIGALTTSGLSSLGNVMKCKRNTGIHAIHIKTYYYTFVYLSDLYFKSIIAFNKKESLKINLVLKYIFQYCLAFQTNQCGFIYFNVFYILGLLLVTRDIFQNDRVCGKVSSSLPSSPIPQFRVHYVDLRVHDCCQRPLLWFS